MIVREAEPEYGQRKISIAEYLENEGGNIEKHEYYRGEVFAMAGANMVHNHISSNLIAGLGHRLKGKPCKPFGSDTRVHIPSNTLFTYPDITVICGKEETLNDDGINVLNPTVMIDIRPFSIRPNARHASFALYRDIPSLKAYVAVHANVMRIESWYINNAGHWELREYKGAEDMLTILAIDVAIPVAEVYEGVSIDAK